MVNRETETHIHRKMKYSEIIQRDREQLCASQANKHEQTFELYTRKNESRKE